MGQKLIIVFTAAVGFCALFGCARRPQSLSRQSEQITRSLDNYPDEGFRVFPTPRGGNLIGQLIGFDSKQVAYLISRLPIEAQSNPELFPESHWVQDRSLSLSAFDDFLLGRKNSAFKGGAKASDDRTVTFNFALSGVERQVISDVDIDKALADLSLPEQELFSYVKFVVYRQIVRATNFTISLTLDQVTRLGGTGHLQQVVSAAGNWSLVRSNTYILRGTFPQPFNFFYLPQEYDHKALKKAREKAKAAGPNVNATRAGTTSPIDSGLRWLPRQMAEGQPDAWVQLGDQFDNPTRMRFDVAKLKAGEREHFRDKADYKEVIPLVTDNRFLIDATFYYGATPIPFSNSYPSRLPHRLFTVNTNSESVEVIDPDGQIICQIIYKRQSGDWVALHGVWWAEHEAGKGTFRAFGPGNNNNFGSEGPIGPAQLKRLNLKSILEK